MHVHAEAAETIARGKMKSYPQQRRFHTSLHEGIHIKQLGLVEYETIFLYVFLSPK